MKHLVILGTSRDDSNTMAAVRALSPFPDYELIELHRLNIQPYAYERASTAGDDFAGVARKMSEAATLTFATPVYWYSMSGTMKNFFDRFTELLSTHKPLGKSLAGKDVYLIASGASPELPEGFETPFRRTAEYFNMRFVEAKYLSSR